MILPSSKWVAKETGYVHGVYFSKGDVIKIESIIIGEYDAKVTFNHNSNRLTIDAMFFRKKFERVKNNG